MNYIHNRHYHIRVNTVQEESYILAIMTKTKSKGVVIPT